MAWRLALPLPYPLPPPPYRPDDRPWAWDDASLSELGPDRSGFIVGARR